MTTPGSSRSTVAPMLFTADMDRGAELSPCGLYRYRLWRSWGEGARALFVMLNPSTADALKDDATIRRCMGFARRWDLDGIEVCNLFAYRATHPVELERLHASLLADPHDHRQVAAVMAALATVGATGRIIAAWGAHRLADEYERRMLALLTHSPLPVEALTLTKAGAPGHPVRLPYALEPVVYSGRRAAA